MKTTGAAKGSTDAALVLSAAEDVDGADRTASGAVSSSERRRGRRGGRLRERGAGGVLTGWRGTTTVNFSHTTQDDYCRAPFAGPAFLFYWLTTITVATPKCTHRLSQWTCFCSCNKQETRETPVGPIVAASKILAPHAGSSCAVSAESTGCAGRLDVWRDWVDTWRRRIAGESARYQAAAVAGKRRCCDTRCCGYEPCIQQLQQQLLLQQRTPVGNSTSATLSCIFRAHRRQLVRHRMALSIIYFSVNPLKGSNNCTFRTLIRIFYSAQK